MNSRKKSRILGVLVAGVVGLLMVALPGAAAARDRNHDNIPDRWEKRHHLSLHKNQARRDQDRDQLRNRGEFKAGLDPHDGDSDNDGVEDGDEGAGKISSFDGTTLTIDLFNGGTISGLVTADTEISCDGGDDQGDEDGDGNHGDDEGDDEDVDEGDAEDGDDADIEHTGAALDEEPGDDEGDDDDQGEDDERSCSADHLTEGAVVQEAELELEDGSAVFEEIELAV
jgi:hypothetical protein